MDSFQKSMLGQFHKDRERTHGSQLPMTHALGIPAELKKMREEHSERMKKSHDPIYPSSQKNKGGKK